MITITTTSNQERQEIRTWIENFIKVLPNGMVLKGCDFLFDSDEEEAFITMNTSTTMDYFLIKECPFKSVQSKMKQIYGVKYCTSVLNGTSDFDTFVRPEGGKHLKLIKKSNHNFLQKWFNTSINKKVMDKFIVDVELPDGDFAFYYSENNYWAMKGELVHGQSQPFAEVSVKSLVALGRVILKWNLPVGSKVTFDGAIDTNVHGEILITK